MVYAIVKHFKPKWFTAENRKKKLNCIQFVTLMNNLEFIYYHSNVQCALSLTECTTAYSSFTCNRPYVLEGCCFHGDTSKEIVIGKTG